MRNNNINFNTTNDWKVPDVELFNKAFTESSRYYNLFDFQKKVGTKYIPPPKAETLKQLDDDKKLFEMK